MTIGSGIAIAGIWIGVALMTWAEPVMGFIGVVCAIFPTMGVALAGEDASKGNALSLTQDTAAHAQGGDR